MSPPTRNKAPPPRAARMPGRPTGGTGLVWLGINRSPSLPNYRPTRGRLRHPDGGPAPHDREQLGGETQRLRDPLLWRRRLALRRHPTAGAYRGLPAFRVVRGGGAAGRDWVEAHLLGDGGERPSGGPESTDVWCTPGWARRISKRVDTRENAVRVAHRGRRRSIEGWAVGRLPGG